MDWQLIQTILTSEQAIIVYEVIVMILLLVLILRTRSKTKQYIDKIEKTEKRRQREGLDSQLANKNRR